ncbi:MAG TPA: aconitate hydratase, partial [Trebonia sp.]
VFLRDLWPADEEVARTVAANLRTEDFTLARQRSREGDEQWRSLAAPDGAVFAWDPDSQYVRRPPFADAATAPAEAASDVVAARVLAVFGDGVTTDHISPSGLIPPDSSAGKYLRAHGVAVRDFNSYGSRRGNFEAAARATFANGRLRNRLAHRDGGYTLDHLSGEEVPIYDAAQRYASAGVPLVILAGRHYGAGSSRDWAAKGTWLLGVRAVLAGSFERIHRSNLVGMGILPLQFRPGDSVESLGLTGAEILTVRGTADITDTSWPPAVRVEGGPGAFDMIVRIETAQEAAQYRHGGILPLVLRQRWLR